jgi:hypothetical protein
MLVILLVRLRNMRLFATRSILKTHTVSLAICMGEAEHAGAVVTPAPLIAEHAEAVATPAPLIAEHTEAVALVGSIRNLL